MNFFFFIDQNKRRLPRLYVVVSYTQFLPKNTFFLF